MWVDRTLYPELLQEACILCLSVSPHTRGFESKVKMATLIDARLARRAPKYDSGVVRSSSVLRRA